MSDLPQNAIVLVATGEEAKVFNLITEGGEISLEHKDNLTPGNLADQGPAGKSPPEQSATESMEATFSKILANWLYDQAYASKFENLILIADPGTLGELRPLLHQEVTDKLVLELDKTLINAPVQDIEKSLKAVA